MLEVLDTTGGKHIVESRHSRIARLVYQTPLFEVLRILLEIVLACVRILQAD